MSTPDSRLSAVHVFDRRRASRFRLLELPADLCLLILDLLSPRDSLSVSHTCRPLRNVATRKWAPITRDLSKPVTRVQFVVAYANSSLDYWVCLDCLQMHRVQLADTQGFSHFKYYRSRLCRRAPCCFPLTYATRQQHIQLALKYTAARDSLDADQQQHLQALLTECVHERPVMIWGSKTTSMSRLQLRYHVKPKIVDDHYLLSETWTYRPSDLSGILHPMPLTWDEMKQAWLKVFTCVHLDGNEEILPIAGAAKRGLWGGFPSKEFEHRLERLMSEAPLRVITHSCPRCPTDVEVSYEHDQTGGQALVVRVWKDLGKGDGAGRRQGRVRAAVEGRSGLTTCSKGARGR